MPSEWRYRDKEDRLHKVSFEELAALVSTEVLKWDDQVQDNATSRWLELDSVIGLRQVVARLNAETADRSPDSQSVASSDSRRISPVMRTSNNISAGRRWRRIQRGPQSAASLLAVVAIPLFVAWIVNEQLLRWRRFPARSNAVPVAREFWFPLIGPVTLLEFAFLILDVCVALWVAAQFLRHRTTAEYGQR